MPSQNTPAGAMPVVLDATSSQSYPTGPVWAPYRLPIIGTGRTVDPRAIGVGFEGQSGGSDSGQGGAGAAGSAGAAGDQGNDGSGSDGGNDGKDKSATDDKPLGAPGLKALETERDARKAAEDSAKELQRQLDELKAASKTEAEKALDEARKEGRSEVIELLHANVRSAAVEKALLAAGAMPSLVADLALAPEFSGLKVGDDHKLDEAKVTAAVEKHKERVPDAYKAAGDRGSADGGSRDTGKPPAGSLEEALTRHYAG